MSYYVKRTFIENGRIGWTGPIRSARQAGLERAAWRGEAPYSSARPTGYDAEVVETTPEVRAEVRAWQKSARAGLVR